MEQSLKSLRAAQQALYEKSMAAYDVRNLMIHKGRGNTLTELFTLRDAYRTNSDALPRDAEGKLLDEQEFWRLHKEMQAFEKDYWERLQTADAAVESTEEYKSIALVIVDLESQHDILRSKIEEAKRPKNKQLRAILDRLQSVFDNIDKYESISKMIDKAGDEGVHGRSLKLTKTEINKRLVVLTDNILTILTTDHDLVVDDKHRKKAAKFVFGQLCEVME